MPIYEYSCKGCGQVFEHLARTMNEKKPACPDCGSAKTEKKLSAFSPGKSGPDIPCAGGQCQSGECPISRCPSSGMCHPG